MTTPPAAPPAPPLRRRQDDEAFKGVCAALARTTDTDPVLWRVAVVVLTVFGGSGLLLYLAGWLTIPEEGTDVSLAERWLRGRDLSRAAVVALVVGAAVVLGVSTGSHVGAAPLVAAALLALVVLRREPQTAASAAATGPAWLTPRTAETSYAPPGAPLDVAAPAGAADPCTADPYAAPPVRRPRPPRSPVPLLTLGAALLVTAVLLVLHAAGVDGLTVGRVLAADLLVVGAGLLVGARTRGARWLVVPALLLVAALGVTSAARVPVDLSAGDRTWVVSGSGQRTLGLGEATLDLGPLSGGRGADVRARLGAGHLVVELPRDTRVELHARLAAGEVVLPDAGDLPQGTDVDVTRTFGPADGPVVRLDVRLGAGQLEVRGAR